MEISFKGISKSYSKFKALDNISFNFNEHGAIGYLGPNGAGKTTTLKIMTNLIRPSKGTVELNGIKAITSIDIASENIARPINLLVLMYERN